jgi:glycosyltransferase involved in cell wall biosynthesis
MPKVSVIVPVYNDGRYIKQCLRSLISQVDVEKEILVIYDEGSKDNSYEEIMSFEGIENVRVFSVPHCTIGKALNFGLFKARGEIIAYAEADKEYFPMWLKTTVEYLQAHPNVKAVGTLSTYPKPSTFLGRCMVESKKN